MEVRPKVYDRQKQFFSEAYRTGKIGWPRTGHSRLVELLVASPWFLSGARVLEIGSGEGRNLLPFLERKCEVVAFDFIHEPLMVARERTGREQHLQRIGFVQGDLFSLPFREGSFDVVFDFGVFHHLRRRERLAYPRWISRILRAGGIAGLGVFSELFRHSPDENRTRFFVTHRGHHDVFFREHEIPHLLGRDFQMEASDTEETGDGLSHYRVAVYRKRE
ncbi:MAG: class I SAM-dependent methyltransferase [Nitrospirota bacterium]|nr:class I SAM-dependent methyltransferase [Nitrospirota bacterium]